jgi:coenzyme F420-reducing hydrogenase delta subunit
MLIIQSIVFGCCVCVDWIAADQLAQRGDVGQIICKLRNNFRIATVMCFARTPADCAVTRLAAGSGTLFCTTHRRDLCTIFSIYHEQWIQSVKTVTALKKRLGSP